MATTTTRPKTVEAPPRAAGSLEVRTPTAITMWATLGALILALEVYVYVAWFARGEAVATPTGSDAVPGATKAAAIVLQAILVVGAAWVLIWVVRKCIRERHLVFDAMLVLAWAALYWQDPLINWIRPLFFYNSYLANLGVWVMNIPGWSSPNGNLLPEPLLLIGGFYLAFGMLMTIVTANVMRLAKQRWSRLNLVALIGIAFVFMFILDFIAEVIFVRTELYAYPGAIRALSLWGGETYQFPLYEPFFVAPVLTAMGALRFMRDDKGRTMVDRGLDQVRASSRQKTTLRVLALVGFINVVSILTYAVPMNIIGLHVDETPRDYPTYLRNGLCGEGTPYACPGPDVPIPLRGSDVSVPPEPAG
jgi:hypothetical protein